LDVAANTGITLTESLAMAPAASVSGLYFAHPQASYFAVGKVTKEQVDNYAARKQCDAAACERWLAPVVRADARPGGVFQCTLPDGSALDGTYDEVIAGERIGLELCPPGGDPGGERIVIAMFAVTRDISELEISERWGGPPPSPAQVAARTARWQRLLDQLVEGIEPAATLDPDA
jgi:uncharacterized protein YndB with AHSA1/START domain